MALSEESIGRRLARLLEKRGLSQTAIASRAGVSQSLISRLLSGKVEKLSPRTLQKLAGGLEVEVEALAGRRARRIVTVGSASGERVLTFGAGELVTGVKYTKEPRHLLAGGSGVNTSSRMLARGIDAWPVVPVVEDDVGRIVVRGLEEAARTGGRSVETEGLFMSGPGLSTPFTTILTEEGGKRTILNEFPATALRPFARHCEARLDQFGARYGASPDAVMIGHIHADRSIDEGGQAGGISQSVINRYYRDDVCVFANFGSSQYRLGADRWEHVVDRLTFFQLDIDEIRIFCESVAQSLVDILAWFRTRCTVIITMDRMGAIALRRGSDSFVVAWPYELDTIVDSTGAGDAFAAGLVAHAAREPVESDDDLVRALDQARLCGGYACTTLGGAASCPGEAALEEFRLSHSAVRPVEKLPLESHESILVALDRAFPRIRFDPRMGAAVFR